MKAEFERKLKEYRFSFKCNTDGLYILYKNNVTNSILNTQLICSEPVDESILGSRNGNVIQCIGYFKLDLPTESSDQDFLILAFQNTNNHCVEFIIVTKNELLARLKKMRRISRDNRIIDMVFWLMPDNNLYHCSDISVEGEWYFLSKGLAGRMADGTEWDYSEFLNDWERLKMV
jgi:hypothetical protein